MNNELGSTLFLSNRFTQAVDYARLLHIERRKGTEIPYMAHLLGVASLVMGEAGHAPISVTEDMVIAAILHDTVEDHGGSVRLDDVRHNFGPNVARMVEGLSDSLSEDSAKKEDWTMRKERYVHRLEKEPDDVHLISAADKLHNARAILENFRLIGDEIWKRFKRGRDQQLWYFEELLRVYRGRRASRIVDELGRVVAELEQVSKPAAA